MQKLLLIYASIDFMLPFIQKLLFIKNHTIFQVSSQFTSPCPCTLLLLVWSDLTNKSKFFFFFAAYNYRSKKKTTTIHIKDIWHNLLFTILANIYLSSFRYSTSLLCSYSDYLPLYCRSYIYIYIYISFNTLVYNFNLFVPIIITIISTFESLYRIYSNSILIVPCLNCTVISKD